MRNQRRLLLSCLASLVAGLVTPAALAQAERTTIVAPFPPGGPVRHGVGLVAQR